MHAFQFHFVAVVTKPCISKKVTSQVKKPSFILEMLRICPHPFFLKATLPSLLSSKYFFLHLQMCLPLPTPAWETLSHKPHPCQQICLPFPPGNKYIQWKIRFWNDSHKVDVSRPLQFGHQSVSGFEVECTHRQEVTTEQQPWVMMGEADGCLVESPRCGTAALVWTVIPLSSDHFFSSHTNSYYSGHHWATVFVMMTAVLAILGVLRACCSM